MAQIFYSFSELFSLPIAKTDVGDFLMTSNGPEKQFLIKGKITKARTGLFYITIEDKTFTTLKNSKFVLDQEVACVVEPQIKDGLIKDFLIVGLEKID